MTVLDDRLPVEPIVRRYGSFSALARTLGLHCAQAARWSDRGIPVEWADRAAVYIGLHPVEVWPEWYDLPIEAVQEAA
jgi:hypothetical protein